MRKIKFRIWGKEEEEMVYSGEDYPFFQFGGKYLMGELTKLIKQEKKKSRREVLEEVKEKFGGGVVIGMGDNGIGVTVKPTLDVYLEEELSKLSNKNNE